MTMRNLTQQRFKLRFEYSVKMSIETFTFLNFLYELNSNFVLNLCYLNPTLKNPAQGLTF